MEGIESSGVWDKTSRSIAPVNVEQDPMSGKVKILRTFTIFVPPSKTPKTKEEILQHQQRPIKEILYKDGWQQSGEMKIYKISNQKYRIRVEAEPAYKHGVTQVVTERPTSLNKLIAKQSK